MSNNGNDTTSQNINIGGINALNMPTIGQV